MSVAVEKYLDHLPLERQVRIVEREGLEIQSQTLWDQINALSHLLGAAHERLHEYVLSQAVIGADETHWLVMGAEGKRKGGDEGRKPQQPCHDLDHLVLVRTSDCTAVLPMPRKRVSRRPRLCIRPFRS